MSSTIFISSLLDLSQVGIFIVSSSVADPDPVGSDTGFLPGGATFQRVMFKKGIFYIAR